MGSSRGGPYEFSPTHGRYLRQYVAIFLRTAGCPPWPCDRCGRPVHAVVGDHAKMPDGCVHHRDHNEHNNDPRNLTATHRSCHTTDHMIGHPVTEAQRTASRQPKPCSPEHAHNLSIAKRTAVPDNVRTTARKLWQEGNLTRKQISHQVGLGPAVLDRILQEPPAIIRERRCRRGHLLTPDNIYEHNGTERCLTCHRQRALDYYRTHNSQEVPS